jgi:hypothetical protein
MAKLENDEVANQERPRPVNPLVRYFGNKVGCALLVFALVFGSCGATALFAPAFFAQMTKIAQNAGLSVYTLVLGVTGNPALQLTTRRAKVDLVITATRDMGILSAIYGESAKIEGTVYVNLGADLKNNKFGVLSCEVDYSTVRTSENRAILAGTANEQNSIKQQAYIGFSREAAKQALDREWAAAKKDLDNQFVSWGLGVQAPTVPTLTDCPVNLQITPTPTSAK